MIVTLRTLFLMLIAPVLILILWVNIALALPELGSTAQSAFMLSGPVISFLVGLTGIATAAWRRATRIAVVPAYCLAFLVALPIAVGGTLCVARACPTV